MKCRIIGCKKEKKIREWCGAHYEQLLRLGAIEKIKSHYTVIRRGMDRAYLADIIRLSEEFNGFTKYDFHAKFFSRIKEQSAYRRWLRMIRLLIRYNIPFEKSYEVAGPTSQKCLIIKILADQLPPSWRQP